MADKDKPYIWKKVMKERRKKEQERRFQEARKKAAAALGIPYVRHPK
jgi:hypothetical protein